jgi:hypothetical protein
LARAKLIPGNRPVIEERADVLDVTKVAAMAAKLELEQALIASSDADDAECAVQPTTREI